MTTPLVKGAVLWYAFPMPNPGESSAPNPAVASRRTGGVSTGGALRLALSLPGGVAPGTFEGGAVCGLLAWMQEVNAVAPDAVVVDVITGASAGALTGLLAARVLLAGDDPVAVYHEAWVSAPSLRALRAAGPWAPLSLRKAREVAHTVIFASSEPGQRWQQTSPVTLEVALGSLRGFSQQLPSTDEMSDARRPLLATSYLDWSTFDLHDIPVGPGAGSTDWSQAIDSVVASASHPMAFSARSLDRESYREDYLASEVVNLPADGDELRLWYTDGGLLDNEPLGRCIARVGERDGAGMPPRLVMLVRSSVRWPPPADNPAWSGRVRPRWTQTLARVLDLVATHATGRDLLRVQLVNARLGWTGEVATKLAELIHADDRDQLERLLSRIEQERRPFDLLARRPVVRSDPSSLSLEELLAQVLRTASGLSAKRQVDVAVVSADATYTGPQALRSLVGFLERRQRENHFAGGYWSMLSWIDQAPELTKHLSPDLIGSAVLAARKRVAEPSPSQLARDEARGLSARTRAELLALGVRTGLITRADVDTFFDQRKQRARRERQRVGHS
jgi:predicted acylesterase/phospholipase RssA